MEANDVSSAMRLSFLGDLISGYPRDLENSAFIGPDGTKPSGELRRQDYREIVPLPLDSAESAFSHEINPELD